jgi:hypothetical protein
MKILIDLDEVIELGITFEQYYLLSLLYFKRLDLLVQYTDHYGEFEVSDVETLKRKELVDFKEFKGDISSVSITEKGKTFVHELDKGVMFHDIPLSNPLLTKLKSIPIISDEEFEELCNTYPKKTGDGMRRLQANINAISKDKHIKTYSKSLQTTKCTHKQVLEAIKQEKLYRVGNNANFWSMLSTYINQGLWMGYIGKEEKPKEIYGSTFK